MKRILILPSLLLLAACSSTGGAYTIGGRVDTVGESNARITNMRTSVDNRLEVIAYAQKVGVISTPSSDASTSTVNAGRPSVSSPIYNHTPNVRDPQSEQIGPQYEQALNAFKDMYKIHTDGLDGLSQPDIKNAYLIAGGTDDPSELTNEQIKDFIDDNYASVLSDFFNLGTESDTWIFEPKTQSLTDAKMKLLSSDDVLTFSLNEDAQIIAVYLAGDGYTREGEKSNVFFRKDPTTGDETRITISHISSLNLKYSDFGRITKSIKYFDSDDKSQEINFFTGGYDLKHIDRSKVALAAGKDSLDFKGKAMGLLRNNDNSTKSVSGDATLNFMNGTETIDLKFSNTDWYDVKIVDTGSSQSISFKPGDTIATGFLVSEPNTTLDYDGMTVDYYGDRGNPTEFVGTATYVDTNGMSMEAAFGGTLVKPTEN